MELLDQTAPLKLLNLFFRGSLVSPQCVQTLSASGTSARYAFEAVDRNPVCVIGAAVQVSSARERTARAGLRCSRSHRVRRDVLVGGIHQTFPPWAEDVTAVEFQLSPQLFDGLIVLLDGLVVELRSLVQCGLEVLNLLGEPVQELVTFEGSSRP